jgi:phage terminase large subunit
VLGVDPARFGTDSTIIVARRGRELLEIRRFRGDDTMTVVGHVIEAIEDLRPTLVVVDEGGLGAGVLDRLLEQRYKMVRGVNFGWKAKNPVMYQNKRAELWGLMRQWLKTAALKPDRVLKKDLTGPRTRPDSSGAIALETKEQMKKRGLASPDAADAVACTFAFPVYHREYNPRAQTRTVSSYGGAAQSAGWMAH